ncbi:MAG TPA: hypothetical protein VF017_15555 [Thermoanaerobaculia bacterium]|nr:hypothetical protein [Thermoanaerobaculia bacterium]
MPLAAWVGASGTPAATQGSATLGGWLERPGAPAAEEATFTGSLSRAVIGSWEGPVLLWGYRIELDGEPVPREDLWGPAELAWDADSPLATLKLGLIGAAANPFTSLAGWTKTAIALYLQHGLPGAVREELAFTGWVQSGRPGDRLAVIELSCFDLSGPALAYELCREVEPLSGLTRGEILRQCFLDAGLVSRIPDGAVYLGGVATDNQPVFEFARAFSEPEGWHWRTALDGAVEAYSLALVEPPRPAHHEWGEGDVWAFEVELPSATPSRWVVRGQRTVEVDASGLETRTTRTEIRAPYAPKVADRRQETDGSITDLSPTPEAEVDRPVRVIVDVLQSRGGQPVTQTTREFAWNNPAAGRLRTPNVGEPDGPLLIEGYYWTQALIEEGTDRYVQLPVERWGLVSERRQHWSYDGERNATQLASTTLGWRRRPAAVKTTAGAWVNGSLVGDDDQSWAPAAASGVAIEEWGVVAEDLVSLVAEGVGPFTVQVTEHYELYAVRTRVDGGGFYLGYSGQGMASVVANRQLVTRETQRDLLTEDKLVGGKTTVQEGWSVPQRVTGTYDWGDFRSNREQESFGPVHTEDVQYNVLSADSYEAATSANGQPRQAEVIEGRLPKARYRVSPWTLLQQQPVDAVVDDPRAFAWFGFRRAQLQSDHVQSLDEALAWVLREIAREGATVITITRPLTLARVGETVLLGLPSFGLLARGVITRVTARVTLEPPEALGTYRLEVPP